MKKHQSDNFSGPIQNQMSDSNAIVCPFCNGKGCQNCQNSGQLEVSPEELSQLQAMMQMPMPGAPSNVPLSISQAAALKRKIKRETIPGSRITFREIKTKTAGLIAFSLLIALLLGAFFSNRFFNSYQPYLASILSVLLLALNGLVLKSKFFQYQSPNDFISYIDKLSLQKNKG